MATRQGYLNITINDLQVGYLILHHNTYQSFAECVKLYCNTMEIITLKKYIYKNKGR